MDWPQKKASVIGLSCILKVPLKDLTQVLANGLPAIATKVVDIVLDMNTEPSEIETKGEDEDGDVELSDEDDEDYEEDGTDEENGEPLPELKYVPADEDYVHEDDVKYIEEVSYLTNNGLPFELDDPEEDDLLRNYESALDHLDEVVFACDVLQELAVRETDFYQKWEATIPKKKMEWPLV
eukprot:TRINITY_DN2375_c0_g1_i3.p1 TRINITY_DN2375_c0_g1~~TRINITY_DN2375_c0_g1_i3.p1  ORF type:complete len:181 (+),score=72.22 TRINITY_DN2375_c0_g1_i3:148-690(+)